VRLSPSRLSLPLSDSAFFFPPPVFSFPGVAQLFWFWFREEEAKKKESNNFDPLSLSLSASRFAVATKKLSCLSVCLLPVCLFGGSGRLCALSPSPPLSLCFCRHLFCSGLSWY